MHHREKVGTKIEHPPKHSAHLSLWAGLVAAILLAIGSFYYSREHEVKKRSEKFNWMKPVPSESQLRSQLTEEQYRITRENGTETLFKNLYWDNSLPGIYVDVITGEPLFSSLDKYDAGLGLATFSKPIAPEHIVEKPDSSHDMQRTEIRANHSNSHVGHVFADPRSPTGRRYLANSAALRFIPLQKIEEEGYGEFLSLFPQPSPAPTEQK
jgi:methionine-R-sulfoxide reductase